MRNEATVRVNFAGGCFLEKMQQARQKEGGISHDVLREHRKARRESQFRFWSRFGVTQSRGSRFEMGTEIPPPVAILLKLYFDGIISDSDLWRAKRLRRPARAEDTER